MMAEAMWNRKAGKHAPPPFDPRAATTMANDTEELDTRCEPPSTNVVCAGAPATDGNGRQDPSPNGVEPAGPPSPNGINRIWPPSPSGVEPARPPSPNGVWAGTAATHGNGRQDPSPNVLNRPGHRHQAVCRSHPPTADTAPEAGGQRHDPDKVGFKSFSSYGSGASAWKLRFHMILDLPLHRGDNRRI